MLEMPNALTTEKSVLGALLVDGDKFNNWIDSIKCELFYSTPISNVINYMQESKTNELPILSDRFREHIHLFAECMEVACCSSLKAPLALIADMYRRRKIIKQCHSATIEMNDNDIDVDEYIARTISDLSSYRQEKNRMQHISEILPGVIKHLEDKFKGVESENGIITGLKDVDGTAGEFMTGDLIIIASRPSMGKSALTSKIIDSNTIIKKKSGLIFTLEMDNILTVSRLLTTKAQLNYGKFKYTSKRDMPKLEIHGTSMRDVQLFIDDSPAISLGEIYSKAKRLKAQYGLDYIVIDHIQLMAMAKGRSRNEEMGDVSAGLKNLARELNIVVIALSQLSRGVERRTPPIPLLSDLRDSGAIEQDADKVIFLYREEYYNKRTEKQGICEMIVAKNRNGATGRIEVAFIKEHMRFENLSSDDENDRWWQK